MEHETMIHLHPRPNGARRATRRARSEFVPGLLVVRVKEDVVSGMPELRPRLLSAASSRAFAMPEAVDAPFRALQQRRMLKGAIPIFAKQTPSLAELPAQHRTAVAFAASVRQSQNEDLRGISLLRLSQQSDLGQVERDLQRTPGIEYAHRVPARWAQRLTPAAASADPLVNRQWGLRAIRWFDAEPLPDARNVKVGVLDTGVDRTHPELKSIVSSYVRDGVRATDIVGHGTHVAGIIAANPNNRVGIAGICRCRLFVWKIFGDRPAADGEYYVDEVLYLRALNAVRNAGVRVINLSIGGFRSTQTEALLFRRLVTNGTVVVAAMGNEYLDGNPTEYPAAYPDVIAVGAINESGRRAGFSNTGQHITLCAPGTNILSTLPVRASIARGRDETEYAAWSGTSMATPHVTAAAALLFARTPDLSPAQIAERLARTATKLPAMNSAAAKREYGAGLLNVRAALK